MNNMIHHDEQEDPNFDLSEQEQAGSERWRIWAENQGAIRRLAERRLTVFVLAGVCALQLVLFCAMTYAIMYRFPIKQYLWTSDARAVCAAIPVAQPNVSAARVVDFAASAAVDLHSYDYLNWHRMLTRAIDMYLTPAERVSFEQSLQSSGMIDAIQKGNMTITSVVSGRPFIQQEGVRAVDHRYFWTVQVPLEIWYYNVTESRPENRILTMTIVRVDPSPINPNGIAIDQIVSTQAARRGGELHEVQ